MAAGRDAPDANFRHHCVMLASWVFFAIVLLGTGATRADPPTPEQYVQQVGGDAKIVRERMDASSQ